jgi:hypothetical protein
MYRPVSSARCRKVSARLALAALLVLSVEGSAQTLPSFTAAQAEGGKLIYARSCAHCHGENLDDGEFGVPLRGRAFRERWDGRPVADSGGLMRADRRIEAGDAAQRQVPCRCPGESLADELDEQFHLDGAAVSSRVDRQ